LNRFKGRALVHCLVYPSVNMDFTEGDIYVRGVIVTVCALKKGERGLMRGIPWISCCLGNYKDDRQQGISTYLDRCEAVADLSCHWKSD
jgi:hypothetical protein